MKAVENIQHEIEVLQAMIEMLNHCTVIFTNEKRFKALKDNLKDLTVCKTELKKLIEAREEAIGREKEPARDAAF